MAGRGQADGVRLLRTGDEADGCGRRNAQKLLRPAAGDLLGRDRGGGRVALKAIWSQPSVIMSAAVAASRAPPTTKPK